jgi:hypothetical protein
MPTRFTTPFFFSPLTLTRLLEDSGYTVVRLKTTNPANTPLRPFNLANMALRFFLWFADALHQGGNLIEVYAKKTGR